MKKDRKNRKLALNTETVRLLSGRSLERVAGGRIKETQVTQCDSDCTPFSGENNCDVTTSFAC